METFVPFFIAFVAYFGIGGQGCPATCTCVNKHTNQVADCNYKYLREVPVGLPANVTTLSLTANKITSLPQKAFVEVTQVTSLWLAHNEIRNIAKGALAVLSQLRNLDLSSNKIVDFPWEDLANLTALQLLKINNNHIKSIPGDAFANLRDLRSVRINNNNITSILEGTFDPLISLSHLQIYENPFDCSCKLQWLKDWMANTPIAVPERSSIVCATPADLSGITVEKLPGLHCIAPAVTLSYHPNLDNTELFDGFRLILHCNATGSPIPEVKWQIRPKGKDSELIEPILQTEKNDIPVDTIEISKARFMVFKNGTLIIPQLSKKEEGVYTCVAINEIGMNKTSVNVAVAGLPKYVPKQDAVDSKTQIAVNKPGIKTSKNNIINWVDPKENVLVPPTQQTQKVLGEGQPVDTTPSKLPHFQKKCGTSIGSHYVSNHAFNESSELKQHTFDFGIIALEVLETEAKVQLNPFQTNPKKVHLEMLYLCEDGGPRDRAVVQWSKIEVGVNSYQFRGLNPGTNYTLCFTYMGEDCQVQVVFTTKKRIPSLIIIVVVSTFLLGIATVPLLGAACCHLLYKYQGKTYKLMMKTQNPDQMEKHMTADFDPRASFQESEKNYNPGEAGEGEEEEIEAEGSVVAESIPESQSKTNPEDFEVGSEYSDRLPLGAEAVNISQEINGNYKEPVR
ncbi:immunoglobulin superfamily containing leucine-rich repeat protein 2 [Protopterus annectens]|uniref:immunoglobulin superfamily containing leucine-rich repeat protein 2 n=1 Tax=Protopterus annectens TaxID=7888 RepID=UPI001CF9A32E|nr:immunoglobulin superfamily containing leucine-rich repeat protein 2 [Protopterus annectens]